MRATPIAIQRLAPRGPRPLARPPRWLLAVAAGVALLAALPLLYLVLRAAEGGADALAPLLRVRTLELLLSTFSLALAVTVGAVALGVPLAWLTVRTDLPWRWLWSILTVAPLAVPSYLLAFAFVAAFSPRGWLAGWWGLGHGFPSFVYGFWGTTLVLTLATAPYVVLSTRAALVRLDPSLEDAARSLGRGPWSAVRTAVLPLVLPAVGAGALLACLYAVSDFGAVSILRYDTLATAIYSQYRLSFDRSAAAVLALALLLLALALVWFESRVRRRAALRVPHGGRRTPAAVRLGAWRWPALALCAGAATASLGIPLATIGFWLASSVARGLETTSALHSLRDSLLLAGAAAGTAILVAVPLARLVVHYPGRWSSLTERLLYALYAIPGISLALAVAFFTLNVLSPLYQTLAALVLAVAMRYLVQPVGALRSPMLQVSPRLVEAARSMGERPAGVLRSVSLPLLSPGIVAGILLIVLSALKELPLTLLLAPPGFSTLATDLWDAAREAHYAQAAVPGMLLLVVSFLSVGLLARRGASEP